MKLLSIQVGKIQTHEHNGDPWTTAYRKKPVTGSVYVGRLNVEGDEQQHKSVHGGEHRAVLMYSAEHYARWQAELGRELPYGSFAENFTVAGLDEDSVCIGDVYQVGDAVRLQVSQPRQPCHQIYKALGIRGIKRMVAQTHRGGWYLRVLQEGLVEAGLPITRLARPHPDWTVRRAFDAMEQRREQPEKAAALAQVEALEPGWRTKLARAAE